MTATDDLLGRNARYAENFGFDNLPAPPATGVAVVACMDARLHLSEILGLAPGDAHMIRNAGGVVSDDVVRSLAISQRLLGTREIVVIQHTGCGMLTFSDDDFRRRIQNETGIRPPWAAESFADLEDEVRQNLTRVMASPFIPHTDGVRGFVYELETGRLREVSSPARSP